MFLAHKAELEKNKIIPLPQFDNKWTLSYNGQLNLVSNICHHQNSLIVTNPGNIRSCPYHGWTWDLDGNPVNSGSTESICTNSRNLKLKDVYEWKNLIFENKFDELDAIDFLNFDHMDLVEKRIDNVKASYINIMHVFLDQDHIPILHNGLYDKIGVPTIQDLDWVYNTNSSIQLTKIKQNSEASDFTKTLTEEDLNQPYGSVWLAVYPYTMIEWQPGALIVTVSMPKSDNETNVLVSKYRDKRYSDTNWKINSEVWETAWAQDVSQSERIIGTPSANLEEQKIIFNSWLEENGK